MKQRTMIVATAVLFLAVSGAQAYTSGVPTGLTGAPGESNCWVAPAGRPGVTFYVFAVAANNDQGTNGDFCYTAAHPSTEISVEDGLSWSRIKELYQ